MSEKQDAASPSATTPQIHDYNITMLCAAWYRWGRNYAPLGKEHIPLAGLDPDLRDDVERYRLHFWSKEPPADKPIQIDPELHSEIEQLMRDRLPRFLPAAIRVVQRTIAGRRPAEDILAQLRSAEPRPFPARPALYLEGQPSIPADHPLKPIVDGDTLRRLKINARRGNDESLFDAVLAAAVAHVVRIADRSTAARVLRDWANAAENPLIDWEDKVPNPKIAVPPEYLKGRHP